MHVGTIARHIAQGRGAEGTAVGRVAGHLIAAEVFALTAEEVDAQVVEAVITHGRAVVAVDAARLGPEQVQAEQLVVAQGGVTAGQVTVKAAVARVQGALEGGDGLGHLVHGNAAITKGRIELLAVAGIAAQVAFHAGDGIGHFQRVMDRKLRLVFQAAATSVPELVLAVGCHRHIHGIAPPGLAVMAKGDLLAIAPAELAVMTVGAGDLPGG